MTQRVDFYVLKTSTAKQRWTFACRLTEKAYLLDLRIVVLSDTQEDTAALDDLLWTFDERSFVPHGVHGGDEAPDGATPVHLTRDLGLIGRADLLVNLSGGLPSGLERFGRVAEIIDADDERRRLGRERFKAYRDLKLPLETHQA
jgi:DNA polymerase IIIc chi subunit